MTRILSLLVLALLPFSPSAAEAPAAAEPERVIEEGREFVRVVPAQPTSAAPGEVEVIEFFWYGCPHCYRAEEHIAAWLENKPDNVIFRRVPATLSRGWALMARAFYTAEQLGVLEAMHPALFAAFHEDKVMLASEDRLAVFFEEKAGVEPEMFREAFNSMAVSSAVRRADILARRYRIGGVPSMVVNGKFITDPERAGGYSGMVDTADTLARWELRAQTE